MSHPDPDEPPDRTPIQIGEVWENPISRERGTVLELPHQNPERRAVAELLALVGARVVGEHRHPGIVERFTALDDELVVKRDGLTSILQGETATIEPNVWHDWWNAGDRDARVRVEVTPGERFAHMIETFYAKSAPTRIDGPGVQRRDRFSPAALGCAARAVWHACSDLTLARLSPNVPSTFPDATRPADLTGMSVRA